jgi:hypothetical protein
MTASDAVVWQPGRAFGAVNGCEAGLAGGQRGRNGLAPTEPKADGRQPARGARPMIRPDRRLD